MSKTRKLWIAGILTIMGCVLWQGLHSRGGAAVPSIGAAPSSAATEGAAAPPPSAKITSGAITTRNPAKSVKAAEDYAKLFAHASNYWDFAHQILSAAKSGDADAQYYLYHALTQCASDNKMYFVRAGQVQTLEQALQWAQRRNLSPDYARTVYERCHEFLGGDSTDLGNASEWLSEAMEAGQPQAQADTALDRIVQQQIQVAQQTATGSSSSFDSSPDGQDPRALLRLAVESKNPDVLFAVGGAQGYLLPPGSDTKVSQLAWYLVACQRGLDCSANSDWVRISCATTITLCAGLNSSIPFVQILAGQDWNSVQEYASEINAKLDSNQWGDLGLGS